MSYINALETDSLLSFLHYTEGVCFPICINDIDNMLEDASPLYYLCIFLWWKALPRQRAVTKVCWIVEEKQPITLFVRYVHLNKRNVAVRNHFK